MHRSRDQRDLHSFPTRRSADLPKRRANRAPTGASWPAMNAAIGYARRYPPVGPMRRANPGAPIGVNTGRPIRSEEHTSEFQSRLHLVCRLLLEKKKKQSNLDTE